MFGTPEHRSWSKMHRRCRDRNNNRYHLYGGRGIKVCARWSDFMLFLKDMGPKPDPRHTIDRIDGNGDYAPGNCRWATFTTQARNRRSNRVVTAFNQTRTMAEWAETIGMDVRTLWSRLKPRMGCRKSSIRTIKGDGRHNASPSNNSRSRRLVQSSDREGDCI